MQLIGIAAKPIRRGPMHLLENAMVTTEAGLAEDCRGAGGRSKKRQVTVISFEQWREACEEANIGLPWYARRANLCIKGVVFGPSDVGKQLAIGSDVILEITGETTPCNRMDEVCQGLKAALTPSWRGGVTCKVLQGGTIRVDDTVVWHLYERLD